MTFAKRAADDGKILAENKYFSTVYLSMTGYHPVAWMTFITANTFSAADFQDIDLFERAFIEEQKNAFPGGQFAPLVLDVDAVGATTGKRMFTQLMQFKNIAVHYLDHRDLLVEDAI